MSGFHFPNSFGGTPLADVIINVPGFGPLALGDPGNGLCGGFVFATLDFFLAQPQLLMLAEPSFPSVPSTNPAAPGSPLFNYLLQRLLDTFVLGGVGAKTLEWLALPTHDTGFSSFLGWLTGHGIAWRMVNQEWPAIQADLDAGMPSPLGLVTNNVSTCHQVLAYGYDLDDSQNLTLYCYDCNEPNVDEFPPALLSPFPPPPSFPTVNGATLTLNISQSYNTIPITSVNISANDGNDNPVIRGIFHAQYSPFNLAGVILSPIITGPTPASPQALQTLFPGWSSWDSPFANVLAGAGGLTLQNAGQFAGQPIGGTYPQVASPVPVCAAASTPGICSWGSGRLDLFIQDQLGFADHLSFSSGIVQCDQLQLTVVSCPAAVSWGEGRFDAFAILNELDFSLVHFWFDNGQLQQSESLGRSQGNWKGQPIPLDGSVGSAFLLENSKGRAFASAPAACTWGPDHLDIVALARPWLGGSEDAVLAHLVFDSGSWGGGWDVHALDAGFAPGSKPCVVTWGSGQIDVFFVTSDWNVGHCSYTTAGWSDWDYLGVPGAGWNSTNLAATSWGVGRLDVFVVGLDGSLYHQWYDQQELAAWQSQWENLGGPPSGLSSGNSPCVASWSAGRLDIFAQGNNDGVDGTHNTALWHLWFDGTWQAWESLGGVIQSDPQCVSSGPGSLDVVAVASDFMPWHVSFQS
jgi:hypothetical protein